MSFPPLSHSSHTLPNKRTSATGRVPKDPIPNLNTRLSTSSYSVTLPGASITTPPSPGPSSGKPRQKSKAPSRLKAHHLGTADSRSKSKAKAEAKPKGSKLRMRVKRAPDPAISNSAQRAVDAKDGQAVDEYADGTPSTEDDETEGEAGAETDPDTEAEADTSVEADASHRTLTVDPFSAEEERIITVLSRKLEQLRESETTGTSPLSPVEASSPPLPLPSSTGAESIALHSHGQPQALGPLAGVSVAAAKLTDIGRPDSTRPSPLVAHKQTQKRVSPPPTTAGYPPARIPSHSRTSSVDSGIYALSPSPAHSSPSSVYAAPVALPNNYHNGSANASAESTGKAKTNGQAVPIAVNSSATGTKGKGNHQHDEIPIDFNNTYHRTYGAHISTLSSPEMSLSASPYDTYDTRWMGTKVNPNGIGFATVANGNTSGRAGFDGLQTTQVHSYEQESESQTQTRLMLHALMQENDQLKNRMAEMEGNYMRLASLNEAYRVELIGYRSRLGLSVDNLIGLASDPLPDPLPPPTHFASTQGPHTYHHQHHPSTSPLGGALSNTHMGNSYINTNCNNGYQSSPSTSTSVFNPPSKTTHNTRRTWGSYVPSRIANGFEYETDRNGITEMGIGTNGSRNSAAMSSTTGVPIPRPPAQVQSHRLKQQPMMMTMPMSVPNMDNPMLYMHNSTSRGVNEPRTSIQSASYSSPPYSNNSPSLLSPSLSSSYSAASSSAASSSAASSASASTNVTSPPSSLSFTMMMMLPPTFGVPTRGLSYPLVPPPSLSSSLGSGSGGWEGGGGASGNLSPVEPSGPSAASRRGSNAGMGVGRRGSLGSGGATGVAGGRMMETGSLRRSRGGSLSHGPGYISRPETVDETEGDHEDSTTSQGLAGIREP